MAKAYLEKARAKAEALPAHELLTEIFALKAEGRYANALEYTKKKYFHEEKFKSRSAGFDVQNYYLQKEKEQLAAEKKSQELELSLRDTQLRSSLVILVLVFFLVVGLVAGLYQQRQAKRKLAAQNALIQQQAVRMENLDVAKSRFFANVSHELHTPLTLLLGPIHALLKENRLTGKQTQMLQMARRSGIQLEQWINDLR